MDEWKYLKIYLKFRSLSGFRNDTLITLDEGY